MPRVFGILPMNFGSLSASFGNLSTSFGIKPFPSLIAAAIFRNGNRRTVVIFMFKLGILTNFMYSY